MIDRGTFAPKVARSDLVTFLAKAADDMDVVAMQMLKNCPMPVAPSRDRGHGLPTSQSMRSCYFMRQLPRL